MKIALTLAVAFMLGPAGRVDDVQNDELKEWKGRIICWAEETCTLTRKKKKKISVIFMVGSGFSLLDVGCYGGDFGGYV